MDSIPQQERKSDDKKEKTVSHSELIQSFCRRKGICMNDYDDVVQTIRDAKRISGFTNQQLADAANVPQSTVNKLLASGCNGNPNAFYLAAICEVLGLSMDALMGISIPQEPDSSGEKMRSLQVEVAHKEELLQERSKQIDLLQERSKLVEGGIRERKPVIYGLTSLCIILAMALMAYVVLDAQNPTIGLIRADGINIWVYLAALAIIGICLFIGQTMVKKRLRRKENENAD
jgi:transcriptional regulator with XRE-family HTH domain